MRSQYLPVLSLLLFSTAAPAAQLLENPDQEKGTYLGVLFSPVPESLLDHLPSLPRTGGVMVTHVLPGSPAETAKLRRHDVLLRYNKIPIRDCSHLGEIIRKDRPDRVAILTLVRHGKKMEQKVTLKLGPVLRLAKHSSDKKDPASVPKSVAKQGGPGKLEVYAEPMEGNRMKLTFEYFHTGTGRLRQITCSGTPEVIDKQVSTLLPKSLHSLAEVAIKRLRALNFQKQSVLPPVD